MSRTIKPEKTYQETYEEFWKELVETPTGQLDKDKVMRELADYHMMIDILGDVYSTITGNATSNPMVMATQILALYDDSVQEQYDFGYEDGLEDGRKE